MVVLISLYCQGVMAGEKAPVSGKEVRIERTDWYNYSMGLHYSSIKEYSRAIEFFEKAATFNKELHLVYYQIAGCHFNLMNYDKASHYADLAVKQDDSFDKPYFLSYSIYMRKKDYRGASGILESLLKKEPGLVNVHYTLGNLYYNKLNDRDKALWHFQKISNVSKTQPVEDYYREYSHYYMGYIQYQKGESVKSIENFKEVISLNPMNSSAYQILISLLMEQYRIDEAKEHIITYLERFPETPRMHSFLGRIYYLREDLASLKHLRKASVGVTQDSLVSRALLMDLTHKDRDSEAMLKFIINKYPEYITPHLALGNYYFRAHEKERALAEYFTSGILLYNARLYDDSRRLLLKVLSIKDGIPEVYTYLGRCYEEKNMLDMAALHYQKSHEIKENGKILTHLGYLYARKNDYVKAMKYYDMAISLEPEDPHTYFMKGLAYSGSEKYGRAEKYLKKAISIKSDDTYYFYLASVQEKQNKINGTIDSLKKAIEINPSNSRAYNYLGYLYADRNINLDESIELVEKALKLEPENGAYLDSLGWAYYRKGMYTEALEKLLEAERRLDCEEDPDPVVYDHIGDAHLKNGNMHEAIKYWNKSLILKDDPGIKRKRDVHSSKSGSGHR